MTMKSVLGTMGSAALAVLIAASAGCSEVETEMGEPADSPGFSKHLQRVLEDSPDLLARVAVAPDHAFEIYGAGTELIVSETGLVGSKLSPLTEADRELGPAELYGPVLSLSQPIASATASDSTAAEHARHPISGDVYMGGILHAQVRPRASAPAPWVVEKKHLLECQAVFRFPFRSGSTPSCQSITNTEG
jgi:hypothetical protein